MGDIVQRLRAEDPETGLRLSIATEAADYIEALEALVTSYETLTETLSTEIKTTLTMLKDLHGERTRLEDICKRAERVMREQSAQIDALTIELGIELPSTKHH